MDVGAGTFKIGDRVPFTWAGVDAVRLSGVSARREGCRLRFGLAEIGVVAGSTTLDVDVLWRMEKGFTGGSDEAALEGTSSIGVVDAPCSEVAEENSLLDLSGFLTNFPFVSLLCLRVACSGSTYSRESSDKSAMSSA